MTALTTGDPSVAGFSDTSIVAMTFLWDESAQAILASQAAERIALARAGSAALRSNNDDFDAGVQVVPHAVLANWAELIGSGLSAAGERRIRRFAAEKAGWSGRRSSPLTATSLRDFLKFWSGIRDYAREPEFALAPQGFLQAEWFDSQARHVFALFRGDGYVLYSFVHIRAKGDGIVALGDLLALPSVKKIVSA